MTGAANTSTVAPIGYRRVLLAAMAAAALVSPAEAAPAPHRTHLVMPAVARTPPLAPALFAKLSPRLTRAGRDWTGQMSATIRAGELQPAGVAGLASQTCPQMLAPCAGNADVDALAFVVLMQAAQDQADDLKDMMANVKAINAQKEALRKLHATIDKAALDSEIDKIKQDIDSQSELGEMESLRLQMAMDRMSKLMDTLSNLLKKISDTDSSILKNLK